VQIRWEAFFGKWRLANSELIKQILLSILGKFHQRIMLVKLNGKFFAKCCATPTFCLAHKGWWNWPKEGALTSVFVFVCVSVLQVERKCYEFYSVQGSISPTKCSCNHFCHSVPPTFSIWNYHYNLFTFLQAVGSFLYFDTSGWKSVRKKGCWFHQTCLQVSSVW